MQYVINNQIDKKIQDILANKGPVKWHSDREGKGVFLRDECLPAQQAILLPHETPAEISLVKTLLHKLGVGGLLTAENRYSTFEINDTILPDKMHYMKSYIDLCEMDTTGVRCAEIIRGDNGEKCYISVDEEALNQMRWSMPLQTRGVKR